MCGIRCLCASFSCVALYICPILAANDITHIHNLLPPPLCVALYVSVLQYYQAANEADAWMNDKAGVAANQDYGRDEDAAVKALKKHKVHTQTYRVNM